MIEFTAKGTNSDQDLLTTLTLPLDKRQKSRQRVKLDNGEEAAVLLQRGTVLYNDDVLISDDENQKTIKVKAACETLSKLECSDPLLFARACYHLGNRHVSLQIETDTLYYLHDHVLDTMVRGLGLEVTIVSEPFEPEPGAYGGSAGNAGHTHHHGH